MRPENEWFKPEKLRVYYFLYEAIGVGILVAVGGFLASVGAFSDAPLWVSGLVIAVPLAVFVFLTWWIPAFYRTAAYRLTDDEIEYRRGVFFQQKTTVPYNRITNVNAAQGPIQRLVDAGSVGIHTAGYAGQTGAELTITGVSDYEEIKDQVLTKVRRRRPAATEGDDETLDDERAAVDRSSTLGGEELSELRRIRVLLEGEFGG
ncbi:PH domain-containing protein [Halolamina rubra]|uniref:PH domain-containing protein n=1 Tax=Halolamina rubra TaxID=1380430 RepID=UPI00067954DF|nr:PH domain-containing protein [Halolamina rubra]